MIPQLSYCQVKIGDLYGGGIVLYVDSTGEHGLVCQAEDLGILRWDEAVKSCKDLGDGWRLPNGDELNWMYTNLHLDGLGGFTNDFYWSSRESDDGIGAWGQDFWLGGQFSAIKNWQQMPTRVRAVRAF